MGEYEDWKESQPVSYTAWCQVCDWEGPARSYMEQAMNDGAEHDATSEHIQSSGGE